MGAGCAIGHLGVEFTELGADHLTARMPVDEQTGNPCGVGRTRSSHQVRQVRIVDGDDRLVRIARCTLVIIETA